MPLSGEELGETPSAAMSPAPKHSDSLTAEVEAVPVVDLDDDLVSVKGERDRLRSRVFELENRLRETEEELEYYSNFYKKSKRENGGDASGGARSSSGGAQQQQQSSSSSSSSSPTTESSPQDDGVHHVREQPTATAVREGEVQPESDCSDSDLEDGAAPVNRNYAGESSVAVAAGAAAASGRVCNSSATVLEGFLFMYSSHGPALVRCPLVSNRLSACHNFVPQSSSLSRDSSVSQFSAGIAI